MDITTNNLGYAIERLVTKHFSTPCSILHLMIPAKTFIIEQEYKPSSRQARKEKLVILVL